MQGEGSPSECFRQQYHRPWS